MRCARAKPNRRRYRGVALLIVLATMVLVLSATTVLVKAASVAKLNQKLDASARIADGLLAAAEAPVVDWLTNQAGAVVIDPAQPSPEVHILHDRWRMGEQDCELAITAWDQLGMVPIEVARSGSTMRLTLPPEVLQPLDQLELAPGSMPGLDTFEDAFPRPSPSDAVVFGALGADEFPDADQQWSGLPHEEPDAPRLGELVATHNGDPVRINVNTAPVEILEAVLRAAGRGGIESIIEPRRQGKPAALAAAPTTSHSIGQDHHAPELVSSSNLWSFRIDVRIGSVRRSWWATYIPAKRGAKDTPGGWECVQRLAIIR